MTSPVYGTDMVRDERTDVHLYAWLSGSNSQYDFCEYEASCLFWASYLKRVDAKLRHLAAWLIQQTEA